MKVNYLFFIFIILLLLFVTSCEKQDNGTNEKPIDNEQDNGINQEPDFNVLVIGWDGVQRDHFYECYNQELEQCPDGLPNLKELSNNNIFNLTITNGATDTKAGWAQILTGYNAEITGVYDNSDFQAIPEGYSIFEKLENYFGEDNIVTFFIVGKGNHIGLFCEGDDNPFLKKNSKNLYMDDDFPWCNAKKAMDFSKNLMGANENVANLAIQKLEEYKDNKFFGFIHFEDPDHTGHEYGENSAEYTLQIVDDDYWLGQIVDKLKELGIYENTYIYIITDHGFDEDKSGHSNAPYGFFASNDQNIVRSGDRKDLTPTILKKYGIDFERIIEPPAVDGYPLDSPLLFECVPEGEAYIDYNGASQCCSGLSLISLDYYYSSIDKCVAPSGGTGDNSGLCTYCGDGICTSPEQKCNCPEDCEV
jgi:hypothetical protein